MDMHSKDQVQRCTQESRSWNAELLDEWEGPEHMGDETLLFNKDTAPFIYSHY